MNEKLSKCGYRCDLCPAYRGNVSGAEDQQRTSDGWFRVYGFRIPAQGCVCDGCLAEDGENARRIDTECPVRPCVIEKGLENCAHCGEYICEKLKQRIVEPAEVMAKKDGAITEEDQKKYIEPYDNKTRLDVIREQLGKSQ